jgi:hypothetical protein
MFRFIVLVSLVFYYMANSASALLTTCPVTSATTSSTRLNATLSASGLSDYPSTLLLASNGNFIFLVSVSDVGSPLSAIQGTWSSASNTLTLTGKSFYFLKFSMTTVTGFTCTYTCGSANATRRSCIATYTNLPNNNSGTQSLTFDLKSP